MLNEAGNCMSQWLVDKCIAVQTQPLIFWDFWKWICPLCWDWPFLTFQGKTTTEPMCLMHLVNNFFHWSASVSWDVTRCHKTKKQKIDYAAIQQAESPGKDHVWDTLKKMQFPPFTVALSLIHSIGWCLNDKAEETEGFLWCLRANQCC